MEDFRRRWKDCWSGEKVEKELKGILYFGISVRRKKGSIVQYIVNDL